MDVLLISTYELGRQPFGLASPAAWLRAAGHEVQCHDLALDALDEAAVQRAAAIALYLPMHAATRRALQLLPRLRLLNPHARLAAFGLYAPLNAEALHALGVELVVGGEFEAALVAWLAAPPAAAQAFTALDRLAFLPPERATLPPLARYARLEWGGRARVVGATEASRGCKHTCRHCPVVPVYQGRFRVVPRSVVLEDVRRQVAAGAEHITFGDPDFLNGPGHAIPLVEALHAEFPALTYDATIKVSHLLKHADLLPILAATGCILITSAVESFDDAALNWLDKGHTRAEITAMVAAVRAAGIGLNPTFVAFCPWTTSATYRDFLQQIAALDLVESVAPIQYAIRLLLPQNSRLLDQPPVAAVAQPFDPQALAHPWHHADPAIDALQRQIEALAMQAEAGPDGRRAFFAQVWALAAPKLPLPALPLRSRAPDPFLTEPWYC